MFIHAYFIIFREGKSNAHLNGDYQRIGDIMVNSFLTVLEVTTYFGNHLYFSTVFWIRIWNKSILIPVMRFMVSAVFTHMRKFYLKYPVLNGWKDKK